MMKINNEYMGAGVLPYSRVNESIKFLFQTTFHGKKKGTLFDFGGYRESEDDPVVTAAREFSEETGGLFTVENFENFLDIIKEMNEDEVQKSEIVLEQTELIKPILKNCKFSWTPDKKYYMFFMPIKFRPTVKINESFNHNKKKREFIWIDYKEILNNTLDKPLHDRVKCIVNINNIIKELCNSY